MKDGNGRKNMFHLMTHSTHLVSDIMVKDHSDNKRLNLLTPLHGLLFSISSKLSFIGTIPQTGQHIQRPLLTSRGAMTGIAQWVHHQGSIQ